MLFCHKATDIKYLNYLLIVLFLLFAGCRHPLVMPRPIETCDVANDGIYVFPDSGSEFGISLKDGRRLHCLLSIKTSRGAHDEVVRFINQSQSPQVIIYDKKDDGWLVDLRLIQCTGTACRPISLTQWLREKQLAWE